MPSCLCSLFNIPSIRLPPLSAFSLTPLVTASRVTHTFIKRRRGCYTDLEENMGMFLRLSACNPVCMPVCVTSQRTMAEQLLTAATASLSKECAP